MATLVADPAATRSAAPAARMADPYPAVPLEMKDLPQWITWQFDRRNGKLTKVPTIPLDGGKPASSTDSATWRPYATALRERNCAGIGFVFTKESGIVGVDIDHCITDGAYTEETGRILALLNSYSEVSPTGTGVHIYLRGNLPEGRRRKDGVEMYDSGRFFTVTGNRIEGVSPFLEDRSAEILELHRLLFPPEPKECSHRKPDRSFASDDDLSLISRACNARNGAGFASLFNGDWQGAYRSQSEADLSLCRSLLWWCNGDTERADRLFRMSGLYREKWDRPYYRNRTLDLAAATI